VDLAVIAHIRHEHTDYDQLLMSGTERLDANLANQTGHLWIKQERLAAGCDGDFAMTATWTSLDAARFGVG
jgi:hypothetical protein